MATLCKNCGGNLLFSPSRGKMYCKLCGSTFRAEDVEDPDKEALSEQELPTYKEVFGKNDKDTYECSVYTCRHCGADIVINKTESSTVCMYCGSPDIVFSRMTKQDKPEGIIPFSVKKADAFNLIQYHIKKAKFKPESLNDISVDDLRGIYIPYRVIDGEFRDAVYFTAEVGSGKHSRTYAYLRAGYCRFRNVPMDAASKLSGELSSRLEPYDLYDTVVFNEDYLSGFYSDIADVDLDGLKGSACKRLDKMFIPEAMTTSEGHDKNPLTSAPHVKIDDTTAVYMLMPAWFLTFVYNNEPYTIMVNGQTGKCVGFIPYDRKKLRILTGSILSFLLGVMLIPYSIADLYIKLTVFMTLIPYVIVADIALGLYLHKKIRVFRQKLTDVRSRSTFAYARKRQV